MSNFLAIATVTATLSQLIRSAAAQDVPAANVTTLRPDKLANPPISGPGVNIFLYHVMANGAYRNEDLPTRDDRGQLVKRPKAALGLHFLLSFYGDDDQLEPQLLLGTVSRTLEGRPVLTRKMIRDTIADPAYSYLAASDLAEEVELVKFSPIPLALEELSRLWSAFFQTPYVLSVAYEGSVVLLDSEDVPRNTLPVRARNLYVVPIEQPFIGKAVSATGAQAPFETGDVLVILGRHLKGESTKVRIRGQETTPDEATENRVSIRLAEPPLAPDTLRAGLMAVQVVHERMMGTPETPHRSFESNVTAVVLRPTLVGDPRATNVRGRGNTPRSGNVTVQLEPVVGRSQRVNLLLTETIRPDPPSYTFPAPSRSRDTDTVRFHGSNVKPGRYLVRVQVDGAESGLRIDTDESSPTYNQYISPWVEI